jgi:hypothetical protein
MKKPNVELRQVLARFVELASGRTSGIRQNWGLRGDLSLGSLCSSCYLQGAEDMVRAIKHGGRKKGRVV